MDEIMLKKLGDRMGSLKHIQAPLLHQSQWVLLTDRQKVGLCSKYEGFYHFLDRTDSDMLLHIYSVLGLKSIFKSCHLHQLYL